MVPETGHSEDQGEKMTKGKLGKKFYAGALKQAKRESRNYEVIRKRECRRGRRLGIGFVIASVVIFYLVFLQLAPWVANLLPDNSWHKILSIVVYVLIGWLGGLAFPLVMFIIGMQTYISNRED